MTNRSLLAAGGILAGGAFLGSTLAGWAGLVLGAACGLCLVVIGGRTK